MSVVCLALPESASWKEIFQCSVRFHSIRTCLCESGVRAPVKNKLKNEEVESQHSCCGKRSVAVFCSLIPNEFCQTPLLLWPALRVNRDFGFQPDSSSPYSFVHSVFNRQCQDSMENRNVSWETQSYFCSFIGISFYLTYSEGLSKWGKKVTWISPPPPALFSGLPSDVK